MRLNKSLGMQVQTGFGLVELMVATMLGLIVTLAVTQVFLGFELQKKTTSGGANAQTNGTVALYLMSRDLQMAGYGLMPASDSGLECNPSPNIDGIDLSPLVITDGGNAAGASDTVAIRFGDSPTGGVFLSSSIDALHPTKASVENNFGCKVGDAALLVKGSVCALTRVAAVTLPTAVEQSLTLSDNASGMSGGVALACLGNWQQRVYDVGGEIVNGEEVDDGELDVNGGLRSDGAVVVNDIVNLQAQYGVSASANSNQITQWVDATGGWAAPSVANRNRIKAIRIAVVARSGNLEQENVTESCSSTEDAAPTGLCSWDATSAAPSVASPAPVIDLSNYPNWQRYRYRVYDTIIPLRNPIWSREEL